MLKLYIVYIDRQLSYQEYTRLLSFVDKEKAIIISKYHFYKDRQRSLIGDILARSAICSVTGKCNEQITIYKNAYGKPLEPSCFFNISHAGDWIVCALSDEDVGVDVEVIKTKDVNTDLIYKIFTKEEQEYIFSFSGNKRIDAFYKMWTLKESYTKAEGSGLTIPLNSFNIHINGKLPIFITKNAIKEDYHLNIINLLNEAYCSICSRSTSNLCLEFYMIRSFLSFVQDTLFISLSTASDKDIPELSE